LLKEDFEQQARELNVIAKLKYKFKEGKSEGTQCSNNKIINDEEKDNNHNN
jgi:hypothetical protein